MWQKVGEVPSLEEFEAIQEIPGKYTSYSAFLGVKNKHPEYPTEVILEALGDTNVEEITYDLAKFEVEFGEDSERVNELLIVFLHMTLKL